MKMNADAGRQSFAASLKKRSIAIVMNPPVEE